VGGEAVVAVCDVPQSKLLLSDTHVAAVSPGVLQAAHLSEIKARHTQRQHVLVTEFNDIVDSCVSRYTLIPLSR